MLLVAWHKDYFKNETIDIFEDYLYHNILLRYSHLYVKYGYYNFHTAINFDIVPLIRKGNPMVARHWAMSLRFFVIFIYSFEPLKLE